jgi:hypothetical protein
MTDPDLAAAWAAVHDATPDGWYVGRPGFEERYNQWSMYAFDASETLRRSRRPSSAVRLSSPTQS